MALLKFAGTAPSWSREKLCRFAFCFVLCSLIYAYSANVMIHQLAGPVLKFPFLDPVFWLAHILHIPETLTVVPILGWLVDTALFLFCASMIIFPRQRLAAVLFVTLYLIYFIVFNTYGAHHTLNKAGILLLPIAFAVDFRRFAWVWNAMRYYLLFIFSCAFFWKLVRLSWLYPDQGELIVKRNLAPYLYFNPETPLAAFYRALLTHHALLRVLFLTGFLLEGCFVIGFFTRKYDGLLLVFFLLLVAGFWLTADAFFVELLIFGLTFLRPEQENALPHPRSKSAAGVIIPYSNT